MDKLLRRLKQRARNRVETRARTHRQCADQRRQAEAQLQQLAEYRNEYNRYLKTGQVLSACSDATHLHLFLQRLNHAIAEQRGVLERALLDEHSSHEELHKALRHRRALAKAGERMAHEAALLNRRIEQRENDEFARMAASGQHD